MNTKNLGYCLGLNVTLVLLIIIGLNSPITAQKDKNPKRKKFGWSLKKNGKEDNKDSKTNNQNAKADDDEVINVNTDLILNDILILNQKEEAVLGLKQSDFIVVENEVPQKIELFSSPDKTSTIPRFFVFIIDHSPSQSPYMENSVNAAKLFVDKLDSQDKMAIVTDDVKLITDFTSDKSLLTKKLNNIYKKSKSSYGSSGGRSAQYSALSAVLKEMFDVERIRPIVILQTDGDELAFLKGGMGDELMLPVNRIFNNFSYKDLLTKVIESRATIYSIIPGRRFLGLSEKEKLKNVQLMQIDSGITPTELTNLEPKTNETSNEIATRLSVLRTLRQQTALAEIAETSGGIVSFLEKPEDAKSVYSDIFSASSNRYLIGYYSTDQNQVDKIRNVKIEVRGHPEYKVLGRKTFIPR